MRDVLHGSVDLGEPCLAVKLTAVPCKISLFEIFILSLTKTSLSTEISKSAKRL